MEYKCKIKSIVQEAFTLTWHMQKQREKEGTTQLPKARLAVDLNFCILYCLLFQKMYNNTENLFLLFSFSSDDFPFLTDMHFTDKESQGGISLFSIQHNLYSVDFSELKKVHIQCFRYLSAGPKVIMHSPSICPLRYHFWWPWLTVICSCEKKKKKNSVDYSTPLHSP